MPLDFLGLKNALFKPNLYWTTSSLIDPVTGEHAAHLQPRNINSYYEITQDIDSLKSTWGFSWGTSFSRTTWRIAQISRVAIHNSPYLNVCWAYKPTPDWKITLGADNFASYRFELEQINFAGPRNLGGQPSSIQDVFAAPSRASICSCARRSERGLSTAGPIPLTCRDKIRGEGHEDLGNGVLALALLAGPAWAAEPRKPGEYPPTADSIPQPGVPKGKLIGPLEFQQQDHRRHGAALLDLCAGQI